MRRIRQTGADRRSALLQAALDLFSTHGYEGTTTKSIAERIGVTEALLFKHFRSKHDLLQAVIEKYGPRYQFPVPYEEVRHLPIEEATTFIITQYLDTYWANRACLRMMLIETWRDREAFRELLSQFMERQHRLEGMLKERALRGEMAPDSVDATTEVITAAVTGFLFRSMRAEPGDWTEARARFVKNLMSLIFDGITLSGSK